MGFGSLGFSELLVIFVIVLVFFGPRRFPEVARSLGSAMREFRRSLNQIQRELEDADPRKDLPGREFLNDIRSAKAGDWLDPNRPRTPGEPERTREADGAGAASAGGGIAGAAASAGAEGPPSGADADEQLPMFEGAAEPERPEAESHAATESQDEPPVDESPPVGPGSEPPPTDDSRSG